MSTALRAAKHLAILFAAASMGAAIVAERSCANANRGEGSPICGVIDVDPVLGQFSFGQLHAKRNSSGARSFLLVEGSILGHVNAPDSAPKIFITLTDAANHKLYSWPVEIPPDRMRTLERYPFASRLDAPPEDARNAIFSFAANGVPTSEGARRQ